MTHCKICGATAQLFDVVDFAKTCSVPNVYPRGLSGVPIYYSRCSGCGFIFTEHFDAFSAEEWQREVYNREYADIDPEYLEVRPRENARLIKLFLLGRKATAVGLDFGGGNGFTARLLTEQGWCFDTYDPFGAVSVSPTRKGQYNITTAFEVFEHLTDPVAAMSSIVDMMAPGPILLFVGTGSSDGLVKDPGRLSWWYAAPRNGHISLYSRQSLRALARKFALEYFSPLRGFHLFSRDMAHGEIRARAALAIGSIRVGAKCARAWRRWQSGLH